MYLVEHVAVETSKEIDVIISHFPDKKKKKKKRNKNIAPKSFCKHFTRIHHIYSVYVGFFSPILS